MALKNSISQYSIMNQFIYKRQTCRFCNSLNLEMVLKLNPSPIGDNYVTSDELHKIQDTYPIELFFCNNCGLAQLLDVYPWSILFGEPRYHRPGWVHSAEETNRYVSEVLPSAASKRPITVVDIGSGDWPLLESFASKGHTVISIDPAHSISNNSKSRNIICIADFLNKEITNRIVSEYGAASLVTANNVFANIDDLHTTTINICKLLAPDGLFVFESIYLADLIENMVFDFIYHEHLSTFSVLPVKSFFDCMGMELIDVKRIRSKGGSLRYVVQRQGGPRRIETSVSELIEYEKKIEIHSSLTFRNFSLKIDKLKNTLLTMFQSLRKQGNTMCGYGASITSTTLIYHFGIGELLEYLVDDNPDKQGRFSPGLHIPVYSPEKLYHNKPDYTVILAWRFAGPIIDKHREFINQGGQFIIPVPEVRII